MEKKLLINKFDNFAIGYYNEFNYMYDQMKKKFEILNILICPILFII